MKSRSLMLCLAGLMLLTVVAAAGDPLIAEAQALRAMANVIRHDDAMLRWREIPWYTDANEGLKAARAEARPVFLWVTGDDPLGRC